MKIYNISNTNPVYGNKNKTIKCVKDAASATYSTAPRKVTSYDKFFFRGYTFCQNLKTKITQNDINKLSKYEGDEFIFESYDFLVRHLGVPLMLRPPISISNLGKQIDMVYDYTNSKIEVNAEQSNNSKAYLFGALRHEIQHLIQNLNILRHEIIGEEAINTYSEMNVNAYIESIEEILNNIEISTSRAMSVKNSPQFEVFKGLKYLKDNNEIGEYNKIVDAIKNIIKRESVSHLTKLRKLAISEMGILDKDSREGKRAEKIYYEFKNNIYYKKDGTIHEGKYQYSVSETEALTAGQMAEDAFSGKNEGCYIENNRKVAIKMGDNISKIKNGDVINGITNEEVEEIKEITETREELENKFATKDEFIKFITKYLFD